MLANILSDLKLEEFLVFSLLMAGILLPLAIVGMVQWRKVRQAELEASLKHEMITRGMSAADIKVVLESSMAAGTEAACGQSQWQRQTAAHRPC
jgi:hypothetical protein